ncbi:hypothetical protein Leryth_024593 [Lithospermum erythrorhizon]|nr:hypothetical protein Leryth_024593 [Lithospermum erythrorhizon]
MSFFPLQRDCGGGCITESVQSFIWKHCISHYDGKLHVPYMKNWLKKLILEVESKGVVVLDELYEQYTMYMTSIRENDFTKNSRVLKTISFVFPDEYAGLASCPKTRKLEVPLQCSLNMLEGGTGCCIWPSSLFLSEFILSYPELFLHKSCVEVGSGAGLVGICLRQVKASKVILTDGDLSTLANMRSNLELNKISATNDSLDGSLHADKVKCVHLLWEYATEDELQSFTPHIVLGADVIYNPSCLPHLVRILGALLKCRKSLPSFVHDGRECSNEIASESGLQQTSSANNNYLNNEVLSNDLNKHPVALIASVIRTRDTFSYFLSLAEEANLHVMDITEKIKPISLLPYMKSYERSNVRMFVVSYLSK